MKAIEVLSMEQLEVMYKAFEEIGLPHRYSEEMGEFEVKLGDSEWLMFFVDPDVLAEEREAQAWVEDSYAVAETYWRQ